MVDIYSKEKRSEIMKAIKGKNTKPEIKLRKITSGVCYPLGMRYRLNHRATFGCPDIVFPAAKLAIFVDGSFWHGGKKAKMDRLSEWWRAKIERNMARDVLVNKTLRDRKWKVMRFWEEEVMRDPKSVERSILKELTKSRKNGKKDAGKAHKDARGGH